MDKIDTSHLFVMSHKALGGYPDFMKILDIQTFNMIEKTQLERDT